MGLGDGSRTLMSWMGKSRGEVRTSVVEGSERLYPG